MGGLGAGHVAGRGDGLVLGVLPGLQPERAPQQRVEVVGGVTGRENGGIGGAREGVDPDPVIDLEARILGQLPRWARYRRR